jgi:hypothetical protein
MSTGYTPNIGPRSKRHFGVFEEKQGRYKKPRIEFFLANFIAGQISGEVNLSKLFSEYKAFINKKKYAAVETELHDVGGYGTNYREFVELECYRSMEVFAAATALGCDNRLSSGDAALGSARIIG